MKSKFSLNISLIILFLSCISLYAGQDIRIIKSDKSSLIFEYIPHYTDTSTVRINSIAYKRISILNGNIFNEGKAGSPSIPSRSINIGVPQELGNTFEVLSYNYKEIKGKLLPVAKFDYKNGEVVPSYEVNQKYYVSEETMTKTLNIGKFVKLRGLPIQKLQLNPVEFDAGRGIIKLYNSIIVRVNYARTKVTVYQAGNYEDDFLRDAVINYNQASDWVADNLKRSLSKQNTVKSSVLASGRFFRFEAPDEGIYKINRATLASLGVDVNNVDPKKIRIFNNGGKVLPEDVSAPRLNDLLEIAIYIEGGDDGKFDEGDYILFYGRGTQFWDYDTSDKKIKRYAHPYALKNYYYITTGPDASAKRVEAKASISGSPVYQQTTSKAFAAREDEKFNLLNSGRMYLGDILTDTKPKDITYTMKLDGIADNSTITYQFAFANRAERSALIQLEENGQTIYNNYIGGVGIGQLDSYGDRVVYSKAVASFTGTLPDSRSNLKFIYSPTGSPSEGYIDYYEIYYTRNLNAVNDEVKFYSRMDSTGLIEYDLSQFVNNTSGVKVFDVSDFANMKLITGTEINLGDVTFRVNEDKSKCSKYIAVGSTAYKSITGIEEVANQDLHGIADGGKLIIITHKNFLQEALRLKAHKESKPKEPISTVVVTVDQIFNEFSSTGSQDVSAIRDFIKYCFDNWNVKPEYVLLFGDGDYDYKNVLGKNQNFVIPYESQNSINLINSYCSDDFYGRISGNDNAVDLAVGRINVTTADEAKVAVDKIIKYETQKDFGLWRNLITLVADDNIVTSGVEANLHTPQSEDLSINILPPFLDQQKIYITQYPTVETGAGRRKPAANVAIVKAINDGTLVMNYIGHGNPDLWAHEHIFEKQITIPQLINDKLFFLSAATCDFGRYDVPGEQSSTELMMIKPDGGTIGTFSSSRAVFSSDNAAINNNFFTNLFTKNSDGTYRSIGKNYFLTKQARALDNEAEMTNDLKFHYFGDPSLKLDAPEIETEIDSINHQVLKANIQIKALSTVKIDGTIRNNDSTIADNFNGEGIITFYDSQRIIDLPEMSFQMLSQGGILFKSRVSVVNGRFSAEFTVPKDISYENKNGKVVFYANNGQDDAIGYTNKVLIGGTDTTKVNDGKGPEIDISFDGEQSNGNNLIGPNSNLKIKLSDQTGLNTTGTGIGHRLEGVLNNDENDAIDFTNYFIGDLNSGGKSGEVDYRFNGLAVGDYKLKVKAWDVFNNSSEQTNYFNVVEDNDLVVRDLFNYPNPFSNSTSFTFQHNLDGALDIRVKVYTVAGRLIKVLEERSVTDKSVRIDWDGRDEDGNSLANGTYLYKLLVSTTDGKYKKELLGKLAVIR